MSYVPANLDENVAPVPGPAYRPDVGDDVVDMPEFTWQAVITGTLLGLIFGTSSVYLVLKVGLTVSASIPVAVLTITLFRSLSVFGIRPLTILENNIAQTAGSAAESIAFAVGVTMPAALMLGFDMTFDRVLVVSVFGGLLGILMMIPLRRALIVQLHGKLAYPEGTACAEVLRSAERGGSGGLVVFLGFVLAFGHKVVSAGMAIVKDTVAVVLPYNRAATAGAELSPELLGVGYVIGYRTSAVMMAGAVMGYLVILPTIAFFGDSVADPVPPATVLIRDMNAEALMKSYLKYIGAGCVATAGIISMFKTLPTIFSSVAGGLRVKGGGAGAGSVDRQRRTERDMPLAFVLLGSLALLGAIAAYLSRDVGWSYAAVAAGLVLMFGFLFVMVSSRLTGEIGSSSNPISGMTIATLLMTCLIFLALGWTSPREQVLALVIGGVVAVAASNGGTTSQDLKTGFLIGGTPRLQQYAILIGALVSASVIGYTLLLFNKAGEVATTWSGALPTIDLRDRLDDLSQRQPSQATYRVWSPDPAAHPGVPAGTYLLDEDGNVVEQIGGAAATGGLPKIRVGLDDNLPKDDLRDKLPGLAERRPSQRMYRVFTAAKDDKSGVPEGSYLLDDDGRIIERADDKKTEAPLPTVNLKEKVRGLVDRRQPKALLHVWAPDPAGRPKDRFLVNDAGQVVERLFERERSTASYRVWIPNQREFPTVPVGKYLVNDDGKVVERIDPAILGALKTRDDGSEVKMKFSAPKTQVIGIVIKGVLDGKLNWNLILLGAMIAVTMELCGVSALAFAVGVYVPMDVSAPIFAGGLVRAACDGWVAMKRRRRELPATAHADEAATLAASETSPGVLLSSGYIAGGSLAGVAIAFLEFDQFRKIKEGMAFKDVMTKVHDDWLARVGGLWNGYGKLLVAPETLAIAGFVVLALVLYGAGSRVQKNPASDVPVA